MKASAHCILPCGLIRLTLTHFGFLKKNTTQLREVGNLVKVKLYEYFFRIGVTLSRQTARVGKKQADSKKGVIGQNPLIKPIQRHLPTGLL